MGRSRFAILLAVSLAVLCVSSCSKKETEKPSSTVATQSARPADSGAGVAPTDELATDTGSALHLPTTFARRAGDLDEMVKERNIRALVVINPIAFFYSKGKPQGITYEALQELEKVVNQQYKTGALKVKVTFIPLPPSELGQALNDGVGDMIAMGVGVTPERQQHYAFTVPIATGISRVVVTGSELAQAKSFDDLVGKDIYVNPLTVQYAKLLQLNEQRVKEGKQPLSIKAADKNLLDDDLIEMTNAGLIPATVAMDQRGRLWAQVLPTVAVHSDMVVSKDGELAWVVRKNNPELKKFLDDFVQTHGAGTSFGNTLLRRYLQNTKWIKNSTSSDEMKKFAALVEYFKKYSAEYNFDYLMIAAQGYQESLLDQNRRSPVGAVGVMQVIPKYAAASPINIKDVGTADKNILAGVRMLDNISKTYFNDPGIDQVNKTLFTFAAYNAGPNRIVRLRKQAAAEGFDPNKWFGNVELEVAKDVGQETVTYVSNIYKYYIAYKLALEQKEQKQKAKAAVTGS